MMISQTVNKKTRIISIIIWLLQTGCSGIPSKNNISTYAAKIDKSKLEMENSKTMNSKELKVTLKSGIPVKVDDFVVTSTPMGHKISTNGTEESFAQVTVVRGDKKATETVYDGDTFNFEHHAFKVVEMGTDGENVTLLIKDTRVTDNSSKSENSALVSLKNGETITIFDLTVMNKGGGHEITESGNDPSWVNLEISTPRKTKVLFLNNFPNENSNADQDLNFDGYNVRITTVDFDAQNVKILVTKKISIKP